MIARALLAFSIALSAVTLLAPAARAQSLGSRLGSPAPNAPPAPDVVPPAPDGLPDWSAEPPPPTASAPPARFRAPSGAPPDLVLTRDGGMIRGTIVESAPGRRVRVELTTGEVIEIGWGEVRFAGRAEEAPAEGSPAPTETRARPGTVHLRFEADLRLTLHRVAATARSQVTHGWTTVHGRAQLYDRLCTAPCELDLDPGVHSFGLSLRGGEPIPVGWLDITRPGTLYGVNVDNAPTRAVGGTIFALGLIGAAIMVPLSLFVIASIELFITGCVFGGVGLLAGIPMMAQHSGVALRFE